MNASHAVLWQPAVLCTSFHLILQHLLTLRSIGRTSQGLTEPRVNLHTLTFCPAPYCSPVLTSDGTPTSEFSFQGPAFCCTTHCHYQLAVCGDWPWAICDVPPFGPISQFVTRLLVLIAVVNTSGVALSTHAAQTKALHSPRVLVCRGLILLRLTTLQGACEPCYLPTAHELSVSEQQKAVSVLWQLCQGPGQRQGTSEGTDNEKRLAPDEALMYTDL